MLDQERGSPHVAIKLGHLIYHAERPTSIQIMHCQKDKISMFTNQQVYDLSNTVWNEVPAAYGIFNRQMQIIYIGQTDNLKRRMAEHQCNLLHCMHRYGPTYVLAEVIYNEATRCARERELILAYRPPCNQR
ncbi:MAG: hypothetical protein AUG51_24105 [Acidobacteria bacterium 13_1_20CM_3_53_8]|nr:MAG: hypothetical protein AUG51_24105 [Acidobacteria bacterium 13_1_20CM_3_53_8]